jgi:hypothetical protein
MHSTEATNNITLEQEAAALLQKVDTPAYPAGGKTTSVSTSDYI